MAVQKAMATGTAKVMDWFDRNATSPYFSVHEIVSPTKKDFCFSFNEESIEDARNILQDNIRAFEENGVNTLFALVLHPVKDKNGFITNNSPSYGMLKFRPFEEPSIGALPQTRDSGNMAMINLMMEKLNAIESRLNADEAIGDMEEDPEQPGIWEQLLADPQKIEQLVNLGVGIATTLGTAFRGKPLVGVAGVPSDNEDIMLIVNSLMSKGVTIEHLKKLDEMSTIKLKSLLLML